MKPHPNLIWSIGFLLIIGGVIYIKVKQDKFDKEQSKFVEFSYKAIKAKEKTLHLIDLNFLDSARIWRDSMMRYNDSLIQSLARLKKLNN